MCVLAATKCDYFPWFAIRLSSSGWAMSVLCHCPPPLLDQRPVCGGGSDGGDGSDAAG